MNNDKILTHFWSCTHDQVLHTFFLMPRATLIVSTRGCPLACGRRGAGDGASVTAARAAAGAAAAGAAAAGAAAAATDSTSFAAGATFAAAAGGAAATAAATGAASLATTSTC